MQNEKKEFIPELYQNFIHNLPFGEYYEKIFAGYLNEYVPNTTATTHTIKHEHDINVLHNTFNFISNDENDLTSEIELEKIELKAERNDTGNIAVEIYQNNKPSGISITSADTWCHYITTTKNNENIWCTSTTSLKKLIKQNNKQYRRIKKDYSISVLVPIIDIKTKIQYIITNTQKQTIIEKYNIQPC